MAVAKLTHQQRNEVVRLYRLGWPVWDIAKRYGVNSSNVCGLARRRGVARRVVKHPDMDLGND